MDDFITWMMLGNYLAYPHLLPDVSNLNEKNKKDLLYSTGNYVQYLVTTCNGKEAEKGYIYVYIYN